MLVVGSKYVGVGWHLNLNREPTDLALLFGWKPGFTRDTRCFQTGPQELDDVKGSFLAYGSVSGCLVEICISASMRSVLHATYILFEPCVPYYDARLVATEIARVSLLSRIDSFVRPSLFLLRYAAWVVQETDLGERWYWIYLRVLIYGSGLYTIYSRPLH